MRQKWMSFVLLLIAFLLPASALADAKQDFVLVNGTGYTISEVYVSPSKVDNWEEDVLGRDVLPDGERTAIRFSRKDKSCLWDLMVVYDDGETAEWAGMDLCTISVIVISYDRKSGVTSATYE